MHLFYRRFKLTRFAHLMMADMLVSCTGESLPHDSFGYGEGPRVENMSKCYKIKTVCHTNNVNAVNIVPAM